MHFEPDSTYNHNNAPEPSPSLLIREVHDDTGVVMGKLDHLTDLYGVSVSVRAGPQVI